MRILIVTGASGGHIFPALALARALREKEPDCRVRLVLPERLPGVNPEGVETDYLGFRGIRLSPPASLFASLCRLSAAAIKGLGILLGFQPQVVVGFGGAPTVPVVFLAWLLRMKTVVHEQNVEPGRANRFLSRFADKTAVSFGESLARFASPRAVLTGNPLRADLRKIPRDEARAALGLSPGIFTVLVTGGSQGSNNINLRLVEALRLIAPAQGPQVIHCAGAAHWRKISAAYRDIGVHAKVVPFLDEMGAAYSAADAAVCRAGAATCAELLFYALPALVVPYPFAGGHQRANAAVLGKSGCAIVVRDEELDAQKIRDFFLRCMTEPVFLERMRGSFPAAEQNAAGRMARLCLEACSLTPYGGVRG